MNENVSELNLVNYLISLMPIPWKKIAFYAESDNGSRSLFFGVREKETDIAVNMDTFFKRYDEYPISKRVAPFELIRFVRYKFKQDFPKWAKMFGGNLYALLKKTANTNLSIFTRTERNMSI